MTPASLRKYRQPRTAIEDLKEKIHALRREQDKHHQHSECWQAYNDDIHDLQERLFILRNAGSERLWGETAAESLAFRHVSLDTLSRWLTLDLPADVLAEIEQELNTRKD